MAPHFTQEFYYPALHVVFSNFSNIYVKVKGETTYPFYEKREYEISEEEKEKERN